MSNHAVVSSISLLNFHANPTAIIQPISTFIIDSINCVRFFSWLPHIFNKSFKLFPSWVHVDIFIRRMITFCASLHRAPDSIYSVFSSTMSFFIYGKNFIMKAAATFYCATKQMPNTDGMCFPAITTTNPMPMRTTSFSRNCCQSTEFPTSKIKWFCHIGSITQNALGWFNRVEITK